tara:strand:+ start:1141 stop:1473 length:333 start_codon:yes stop_codon:yes gene_type:complete
MNEDKTWSIKHEGPLNKNNTVFKQGLVNKPKDMDDMWVCDYCGSEEVDEKAWVNMNTGEITEGVDDTPRWCNICNDEVAPMTYFDWQEKIAEECMGNKDKYDKIMDGSRV